MAPYYQASEPELIVKVTQLVSSRVGIRTQLLAQYPKPATTVVLERAVRKTKMLPCLLLDMHSLDTRAKHCSN